MTDINTADYKIEGIDVQKGISNIGGNIDNYFRVVRKYYENGRKLTKEIAECLKTGDIKNYNVYTHALGSISKVIGAESISKFASELEAASANGDMELINGATSNFLDELTSVLDNIHELIFSTQDDDKSDVLASKNSDGKKKILIVDDTDSYIMMLDDLLSDDYDIYSSLDGEDGLETAKLTKPDIILLDLVMPGISGYEVLKCIKSNDKLKHITVILMSGMSVEENEEKGYRLGAAAYIKKPFNPKDVKDIIKNTNKKHS